MLQRTCQIVAVAKIEIAIQIDVVEYSQIALLQRMRHFRRWLAHTNHHRVFDRVNDVHSNYRRFRAGRHQNEIITFHETDETQHTIRTDFLYTEENR